MLSLWWVLDFACTMKPSRAESGSALDAPQTPEQIVSVFEAFLADHPKTAVIEEGKVLFDMARARYSIGESHGRCTLHLWDEERNIVRTISAATMRGSGLRLTTHRFGQRKPGSLELLKDREQRTPIGRDATRTRYLKMLEACEEAVSQLLLKFRDMARMIWNVAFWPNTNLQNGDCFVIGD